MELKIMEDVVELAGRLHGHLSPGVALGVRMGQIGLKILNLRRGDKRLFAIVETTACLADGIQASTGCTAGHSSIRIEDFGKLAVCIARSDTGIGVRISLKYDSLPPLVRDWALRKRKISHDEEDAVSREILGLDEKHFHIEWVRVELSSRFDDAPVVFCEECGEGVVESKVTSAHGKRVCKACGGERYYKPLSQ